MSKTLDRKRPFGQVHGAADGRCYEQDGVTFNSDGDEWTPGDGPQSPPVARGPTREEYDRAVASAAAELAAQNAPKVDAAQYQRDVAAAAAQLAPKVDPAQYERDVAEAAAKLAPKVDPEQYQRDVQAAAEVLAARMASEKAGAKK